MDRKYRYLVIGLYLLSALCELMLALQFRSIANDTPIFYKSHELLYWMTFGIGLLFDAMPWLAMAFLAFYFAVGTLGLLSIAVLFVFCKRKRTAQSACGIGIAALPAGLITGVGVVYLLRKAFPDIPPSTDAN
jgi:ABC-type Na+ efflux pump permease subunit